MDEQGLRAQICDAARQLWLRGLIVADAGLLTAECHRQRYLVTPTGRRRSDLGDHELQLVDLGGQYVNGGGLAPDVWRPHRLAYRSRRDPPPGVAAALFGIHATAMVEPPNTTAVIRLRNSSRDLELHEMPGIPIVDVGDEEDLVEALTTHAGLIVRPFGLMCVGPDLASVLNVIERVEHAATVELACMQKL